MSRYIRLTIVAVMLALASMATTGVAHAAHRTVEFVSGNPSCDGGLKIEPVTSGTYDGITITVSGSSFSFTSTDLVSSVIVKGGPNANIYTYLEPRTSDTGLIAPINPSNGKPYGLSHLCFFTDKKDDGKG